MGGPEYERILTVVDGTPEDSTEETAGSSRDSSQTRAGDGGPSDDSSISITVNGKPRRSSGGGVSGLSTVYGGEAVGNANLWGNTITVAEDDQLPAYSAMDDDDEPAVLISSSNPVLHKPVGFTFTTQVDSKKELLDMNGSDVEGETSGGVVIPFNEEDAEPAEIRVDGEDTITPAGDGNKGVVE